MWAGAGPQAPRGGAQARRLAGSPRPAAAIERGAAPPPRAASLAARPSRLRASKALGVALPLLGLESPPRSDRDRQRGIEGSGGIVLLLEWLYDLDEQQACWPNTTPPWRTVARERGQVGGDKARKEERDRRAERQHIKADTMGDGHAIHVD